jgi:hypothetical protein
VHHFGIARDGFLHDSIVTRNPPRAIDRDRLPTIESRWHGAGTPAITSLDRQGEVVHIALRAGDEDIRSHGACRATRASGTIDAITSSRI